MTHHTESARAATSSDQMAEQQSQTLNQRAAIIPSRLPADPTPAPAPVTDGSGPVVQLKRIVDALWIGAAFTSDLIRFGLVDKEGNALRASERVWAQEWIETEMRRLGHECMATVARMPENTIRIQVWIQNIKGFDRAYQFANAEVK